jgi:DNA-binding LytR/AlgR family response regulator
MYKSNGKIIENSVISALIVEDEVHAQDILEDMLSELPEIRVVDKVTTVDDAIVSILNYRPDLVFLDIDLPGKNGFELIHELNNLRIIPVYIFVTAYNDFAISAIRHSAFDYLLKPINPAELRASIDRLRYSVSREDIKDRLDLLLNNVHTAKIRFNNRTGIVFIDAAEILYCRAEGNYTEIVMSEDQVELVTLNIGSVEEKLPLHQFLRISRSIIINQKYLSRICRKSRICLLDKDHSRFQLNISKSYLKQIDKNVASC